MPRLIVVGTINKYPPPAPGWEVVHVDKSERGIWDPDRGMHVPIDVRADMRQLPFADHSVDRIQSWHALEHVNEQGGRDTISEFARVLKHDGILDIRVPDMDYVRRASRVEDVLRIIYGDQTVMPDPELNAHRWGYTLDSLKELLWMSGFEGFDQLRAEHPDELHLLCRYVLCN